MHRVIALNGVPETTAATNKPKPAKPEPQRELDLSRTVHEWAIPQLNASASQWQEPAASTESTALAVSTVSPAQSLPDHNIQATAEAHWATHSSINLEVFEETPLPPRILNTSIEDAVTQQYDPATASRALAFATSSSDLASLDRALESARVLDDDCEFGVITNYQPTTTPEPLPAELPVRAQEPQLELHTLQPPQQEQQQQQRMLLVPVSIVWTVLTVFLLCVLALTGMLIAALLRGQL